MSRKKVSTTIYITPEQADRLKLLHERTKVPVSVYIREGIDMMLKHYEHVLPGQMSLSTPLVSLEPTPAPPATRTSAPIETPRGSQARAPRVVQPVADEEGGLDDEAPEEEAAPTTLAGASDGGAAPKTPGGSRGGQRAGAIKQPGPSRSSGDGT